MNDTKDIQTIREALDTSYKGFCGTPQEDRLREAISALSRLEARLSAHQEVLSALSMITEISDRTAGSFWQPSIDVARAALARAKEAK